MWHRGRLFFTVLLALIAAHSGARTVSAVEIHGTSSTQLIWYNDIFDDSKKTDLVESLRVSATGLDADNKLSVKGYGRAVFDLKDNTAAKGRLYYFYADYKDFLGTTDIRLGRQFMNLSAGSALVDGLQVDVKHIGPVGFTLVGGQDVVFGDTDTLTSHAYSLGAAAYLTGFKKIDFDVSYYRGYDYSDITRDIIGASYKQYLFDSLKIYANVRYDLTAEVFNEALAGINYFPTLDLMLTAEYYESYPTFDTTSIFSVFAVDKYKEEVLKADYTVTSWLDLSGGFTHEDVGEGDTANTYEVGVKLRPTTRTIIGLYHDQRSGNGGDLDGYKIFAEYSSLGKWKAAAGIDHDAYQRDNMTGEETASKYWASGRYSFAKNMSSTLFVENNVTVTHDRDLQGRLTFDYNF